MVFYVYLQSEVIADVAAAGPHGLQNLISTLRSFLQNCCVAEFIDGRTRSEIGAAIEKLPEDFDRTALKKVLVQLTKLNRFVYCLEPDYNEVKSDLDCVFEQAESALIQMVVVAEAEEERDAPTGCELAPLSKYQEALFEEERSRRSSDGRTTPEAGLGEQDFLDEHFQRALRHAGNIEMCDRLAGTKFADNYKHTIKRLFQWLETALEDPGSCAIVFHLGEADGHKSTYIKDQLTNFRSNGSLSGTPVEIRYYRGAMPHQRFILTDQFALEIDRGLDFLDRATHKNRDVSVNTKSHSETSKLLAAYSGNHVSTDAIN
jgi:hypothetical protein